VANCFLGMLLVQLRIATRQTAACTNTKTPPCGLCGRLAEQLARATCSCGGGAGVLPEVYVIDVTAANGGAACPHANGTTRQVTACTNSHPCPVSNT